MSKPEHHDARRAAERGYEHVGRTLGRAWRDTIPETIVETLVNGGRAVICPGKITTARNYPDRTNNPRSDAVRLRIHGTSGALTGGSWLPVVLYT